MEPAPPAAPRRVLVMDDEPLVRSATIRLTASRGYEAEGVPDGATKFARHAEVRKGGRPFDVVPLALDPAARAFISSGRPGGEGEPPPGAAAALEKPYGLATLARALPTGAPPALR